MRFLGTGAAELYPCPYCGCAVCEHARKTGSDARLRTAFVLNEGCLVDFGDDILAASVVYNQPFSEVEDVFITHTHEDHFSPRNIGAMTMAGKRVDHLPIKFHMSQAALDWTMRYLEAIKPLYAGKLDMLRLMDEGRIELRVAPAYQWFEAAGMRVFAVESNHVVNGEEHALNYLFALKDGRKLLYATDTGLYSEKNLVALRGSHADVVVMEGTFGSLPLEENDSHLNAEHYARQLQAFLDYGIVTEQTRAYVTHINQRNTFDHAQYQAYMDENAPIAVTVARDGMEI